MTSRFLIAVAALVVGLFAAGCGSSDDESSGGATQAATATAGESESEAEREKEEEESGGERSACKKPATSEPTGLPSGFPAPAGLTITEARKAGPTVVVEGYYSGDLPASYTAFQDEVGKAGYKPLFKEREDHDAEISYAGAQRQGQIALRDTCSEPETTNVHITNRPA